MLNLFIGGPADGRWIMIPDDRQTWRVATTNKVTHPMRFEAHEYVKEEFREGDAQFFVFVHSTCQGNVFASLLKGYRQP